MSVPRKETLLNTVTTVSSPEGSFPQRIVKLVVSETTKSLKLKAAGGKTAKCNDNDCVDVKGQTKTK